MATPASFEFITDLPAASTIDATADVLPIVTNNINTTQKISRNTFLGISSQPVGISDVQTLTNKVISITNTITALDSTFTIQDNTDSTKKAMFQASSISTATTRTYTLPDVNDTLVTLTASQTLTNKTLTSPTITAPTITNATISTDTLTGFTTSNTGTIYGISVTTGQISSALTFSSLLTASNGFTLTSGTLILPNNSITGAMLATTANFLGYTQITANITTTSTTAVQATGLTSTVTIPAGGRRVKITVFANVQTGTSIKAVFFSIWDGTVGSGTQLALSELIVQNASNDEFMTCIAVVTPAAGSKTYNLGWSSDTGGGVTSTISCSATKPAFILVEAI